MATAAQVHELEEQIKALKAENKALKDVGIARRATKAATDAELTQLRADLALCRAGQPPARSVPKEGA